MRARGIKPKFFVNGDLVQLPPLTRLLFIGLWCMSDREGRLEDIPITIKLSVLPGDDCDVDKMLGELDDSGFIVRYEVDKTRYIQVKNFTKHQSPHVKERASTIPSPSEHQTSTGQTPDEHPLTVDCGLLTSDSGLLTTEKHLVDVASDDDHDVSSNGDKSKKQTKKGAEHPKSAAVIRKRGARNDGERAFLYWVDTMEKRDDTLYEGVRRTKCQQRLDNDSNLEDLKAAIDGCKASPYNMGENERSRAFNDLELICRSRDKVEGFRDIVDETPNASNLAPRPTTPQPTTEKGWLEDIEKWSNGKPCWYNPMKM